MNKSLIICDRLMYGALLMLVFVTPYSLALIAISQGTMTVAWVVKRFLMSQTPARQGSTQEFNFASRAMWWSLIAIGLLIVLTVPFSHYPALSLRKFFTRFLQQIFLMYMVTQIVDSRKRLYGILTALMLTLFLLIIDVVIQYTWGRSVVHHTSLLFGRVTGPMDHPNDLGTLLATVLPVAMVSVIICRKRIPLLVLTSLLTLSLAVALGLTASRGAWVAFSVSIVTMVIYLKAYKLAIPIILVLALFSWVFGMHCLSTRVDTYGVPLPKGTVTVPSFTNPMSIPPDYSAAGLLFGLSGREFYWKTAASVVKHYPWFGCGYSAYVQTLRDLNVGHEEYPHSIILHITAELGFLGLILYGWFYTALWLQVRKVLSAISHERDLFLLGCGISAGVLAWMVHSLMDTAWSSLQLNILWWLFVGILLDLKLLLPNQKAPPVVND